MPSLSGDKDCNMQFQIEDNFSVRCDPLTASLCNKDYSKSMSINRCSGVGVDGFDERVCSRIQKPSFAYYGANGISSSPKSNTKLGSAPIKRVMDEPEECSFPDFLATDLSEKCPTEKELCISILRRHGLLQRVFPVRDGTFDDLMGISTDRCDIQSCRTCGHLDNPLKMLICDHCEDAFHVTCCNPRIKTIPVDEWYCQPCSKKKCVLSSESNSEKGGAKKYRSGKSKEKLNPISFMLKDNEPYTTGVRMGKAFQADVPDWSGPISNDINCFGEPLEMDPTKCGNLYEWNTNKSTTLGSIGNWLQCREVLDDNSEEGTICGKWRRAPLFEVQTDDWDCSCALVWDPIHADCAVPQELETDQVLKHLKYIETLRLRLVAKKRKCNHTNS